MFCSDCKSAGGVPGEQRLCADQERAHHPQRDHRPVPPHLGKYPLFTKDIF